MFDYSVLPERIARVRADGERCIMVSNGNILETSWYMRGFERMLTDLAADPELAWALMERVTDFYVEHFREMASLRLRSAGKACAKVLLSYRTVNKGKQQFAIARHRGRTRRSGAARHHPSDRQD